MKEAHEVFGPVRAKEHPAGAIPALERADYDLGRFSMPASKDMVVLPRKALKADVADATHTGNTTSQKGFGPQIHSRARPATSALIATISAEVAGAATSVPPPSLEPGSIRSA